MYKVYYIEISELKKNFSFDELYNLVSSYRKNKVDKLKFEEDKWLSLGAEYLLMNGLKEFGVDYSKVEIDFIQNGKPVLKNCSKKLYYNLSHSGEMAMCIISDLEVGCDIQKISNNEKVIEIAKRFFHPKEVSLINEYNGDKNDLFYRIWTLKESFIKSTGNGFRTPLKDFIIGFENSKPMLYENDTIVNDYILEEKDANNPYYKSSICIKLK